MNDEDLKEIDGGEITFHLWLCYDASLMWLGKSQKIWHLLAICPYDNSNTLRYNQVRNLATLVADPVNGQCSLA